MEVAQGSIIIVTAPSGAGKSTLLKHVMQIFPQLKFSVSATTRSPREGEIDGVHYHFISEDEFLKKIDSEQFIEWEQVYDYYYGTLKSEIEKCVRAGETIILEIEVNGAMNVKRLYPQAHMIFVMPPDKEVLIERLISRNTESPEDLQKRIARAEMEFSMVQFFEYKVVNDDLKTAKKQIIEIVNQILTKKGK